MPPTLIKENIVKLIGCMIVTLATILASITISHANGNSNAYLRIDHYMAQYVKYDGHALWYGDTGEFPPCQVPTHLKSAVYELQIEMRVSARGMTSADAAEMVSRWKRRDLRPSNRQKMYWRQITRGNNIGRWQQANYRRVKAGGYWIVTLPLDDDLPDMIEYYGVFDSKERLFSDMYHIDFTTKLPFPTLYRYHEDFTRYQKWNWSPQAPYQGTHTAEAVKEWIKASRANTRSNVYKLDWNLPQ